MERPLIGISAESAIVPRYWGSEPHQVVVDAYIAAVRAVGGIPIALPVSSPDDTRALLRRLDGVVLTGGNDVDPSFYGEERLDVGTGGDLDPARDRFDLALADAALTSGVPMLCICRGMQILNVARGGSLIQHLETHGKTADTERVSHPLTVDPRSRFADRFPDLRVTNSYHHQAIHRPGRGVQVVATAPDGVAEVIEVDDAPHVVGVQWHPELLVDHPEHLALFRWLIDLAEARASG